MTMFLGTITELVKKLNEGITKEEMKLGGKVRVEMVVLDHKNAEYMAGLWQLEVQWDEFVGMVVVEKCWREGESSNTWEEVGGLVDTWRWVKVGKKKGKDMWVREKEMIPLKKVDVDYY